MAGLMGQPLFNRFASADVPNNGGGTDDSAVVVSKQRDRRLHDEVPTIKGSLSDLAVPFAVSGHQQGDVVEVTVVPGVESGQKIGQRVPMASGSLTP